MSFHTSIPQAMALLPRHRYPASGCATRLRYSASRSTPLQRRRCPQIHALWIDGDRIENQAARSELLNRWMNVPQMTALTQTKRGADLLAGSSHLDRRRISRYLLGCGVSRR
ncbi:protein of unknown function [Nitrospira defluvii]|uniref:Uncharacterized protein n=1 Tax=Nitrospira defluvii TaxID=330214 RepID=D8PEE4_9BACT|nr:protein of unknown function [Nitrospira defluvii]